MKNIERKTIILEEVHPFTLKEEKEIKEDSIKQVKPYLDALDKWRKESLSSNYRI